jgi:hypothetical protein
MIFFYKAKHKANMNKEAKEKKLSKQISEQEANQRAKKKAEEEKFAKELSRQNPNKASRQRHNKSRRLINFPIKGPC